MRQVRTENAYLDGLRRLHQSHVVVLLRPKGVDPAGCIRYAVAQSRIADNAYSEVWCVVDVDEFDLDAASQQAADAKDVAREVRRILPEYDKTKLVFEDFAGGVGKAVERARRLEKDGATAMPNPSSGMWRLAARIVGDGS